MSERLDEQQLETIRAELDEWGEVSDGVVDALLDEVRALRAERDENEGSMKVWRRRCQYAEAERDRLRDGIAAHRDWVTAEGLAGTLPSKRLWALLDGEADDE